MKRRMFMRLFWFDVDKLIWLIRISRAQEFPRPVPKGRLIESAWPQKQEALFSLMY
jgi:hypothetical protein